MEFEDTLSNHFLIAMPNLADPNFFHTVTYICEHSDEGAMGIVVNRPLEMTLGELFEQLEIDVTAASVADLPVYQGGPVHPERGFILHRPLGEWQTTLATGSELGLTASRDILEAIAEGRGPEQFLVVLGYAGWGEGQLEDEILDNAWLSGPVDTGILFTLPLEQRWNAAASLLGVDLSLLPSDAGHA